MRTMVRGEELVQDLRFGLRMLSKSRGFAAVAILTLGLGIGATSAVFSVVDSVLLRSLPYHDPARLVWISDENPREQATAVLEPDFFAYQRLTGIFESVSAYEPGDTMTLSGADEAFRLNVGAVSYNFFDTLGVRPQLGRLFLPEEDRQNAPHVVLLTDSCWRQHFAADPGILGRVIALDGKSYQVVGILPPQFEFLDNIPADVIVPSALENYTISPTKGIRVVQVVARLRPGLKAEQAAVNLDAVNQRQWASYPAFFAGVLKGTRPIVIPLQQRLVGKARPALLVLLCAIAFVLLIACVNIANLQLARAVAREREIAVRAALGASRWRVVRQLLTENSIIALAGGACGFFIAASLIQILRTHGPSDIPHLAASRLNLPVFGFAVIVSLTSGMLFGLAPALAAFHVPIVETIKKSGSTSVSGLRIRRSHSLLVVAELALALVLFIGAGLLLRSFVQLASVAPGFEPRGVLTARISLPVNLYETQEKRLTFFRELEARLRALPGVDSVGLTNVLPLHGFDLTTYVQRNDQPRKPLGSTPSTPAGIISPGYFSTLRIPLLVGGLLDVRNSHDAATSVVVNQAFAQRYFPNENPFGSQLRTARDELWTIVGVVGNSKQRGLGVAVEPEIFLSVEKLCPPELTILLRTKGDPKSLMSSARSVVASLDKSVPLFNVQTANEILRDEIASQRFNAALLTAFAMFALLLAVIGIYGVMAYAVHQRVHEVGIRMAIGAKPTDVLWLILSHGLVLAGIGLTVGVGASFALTRLMSSLLFSVRATDPLTYAGASLLLASATVAACFFPARCAMRVDPIIALRYE
jgi:putative ABC transport system permease protein